jgi:hypothetical protein
MGLDSALRGSDLRSSGFWTLEGAGEPSPAARSAIARAIIARLGPVSSQAVWRGRARRLVEQPSRQRALRLPQQESTRQPEQQPGLSGRVARLSRSSDPSSGLVLGRDGAPGHPCRARSGNAGRSAVLDFPAEVKEEEQRQTGLVRALAERQGGTGAPPAPGAYKSMGTARSAHPPLSAPFSSQCGSRLSGSAFADARLPEPDWVCLIHPPSSLPICATIRLACSY